MADHNLIDELREAEQRLQAAMLAGNVAELDLLLDDRLIYTGPPDGKCLTKQDDLRAHRSQQLILTKLVQEELTLVVAGHTGVTWVLAAVEGTFAGTPFAARLRYTRTWIYDNGWRILAAHASPA